MSYDVTLTAETGGEPFAIWDRNHTSNTSRMWREAGCDIASYDGKKAWELRDAAGRALEAIDNDPEAYRHLEPGNGWGTVESTLDFLWEVHDACMKWPETTVRISR